MSDGGKGSTQRPTDHKAYANNYDLIFGKKINTSNKAQIGPKNPLKRGQKGPKNTPK